MLLQNETFGRLCRARDWLDEAVEHSLPIEQIARRAGISTFHFIRQFQALFGMTPHQFRLQARLNVAKRLLAEGQHSVTEVCMAVGFSSLGSFSGSFKRRVGASPSAYRRRFRVVSSVPMGLARELVPGCFGLMGGLPRRALHAASRSACSTSRVEP